jgi:hypothetical protein
MLYRPGSAPTSHVAAKAIEGRKLSRKPISPSHRALLAVDLMNGTVQVSRLTGPQARALTGASVGYVGTASRLNPEEREQVERGKLTLSAFHNNKTVSDARIDRFIAKAGAENVMRGLDRWTQPQLFAAE